MKLIHPLAEANGNDFSNAIFIELPIIGIPLSVLLS